MPLRTSHGGALFHRFKLTVCTGKSQSPHLPETAESFLPGCVAEFPTRVLLCLDQHWHARALLPYMSHGPRCYVAFGPETPDRSQYHDPRIDKLCAKWVP
jgi:hypothetical protein